MDEKDFFPGFAWAVPRVFADALRKCRFDEGDAFYDRIEAYGSWSEALKVLGRTDQLPRMHSIS